MMELLDDANQKYRRSAIGVAGADDGEPILPYFIDEVLEEGPGMVQFRGQVSDGKMWTPKNIRVPDDIEQLELGLPDVGAINVRDTVLYMWRKPERQWSRGFSGSTIGHFCVNRYELQMMELASPPLMHYESLWHVFNPQFPYAEDAFKQVDSLDYLARAWNHKYYFIVKAKAPKILVGYKRHLVGWAENAKHVILNKRFEHLAEELGQYMKVEVQE